MNNDQSTVEEGGREGVEEERKKQFQAGKSEAWLETTDLRLYVQMSNLLFTNCFFFFFFFFFFSLVTSINKVEKGKHT